MGTGILFFVLQFLVLIGTASDNLVIAQVLGAAEVTPYAVVQKLFTLVLVAQLFIVPLWPAFGEAIARGEFVWARRTLNRALVLSITLSIFIALPLLVFGKQIIGVWVSPDLVPPASLLAGFAVYVVLAAYGGAMSAFLNAGSLLRHQVPIFAIASLTAIILKIVLANFWGPSGVIWATVLGYGVFYTVPASVLAYGFLARNQSK